MVFHENRLLADDSHEISYLISFQKLGKMSQNLLSAAVVIGALRVKIAIAHLCWMEICWTEISILIVFFAFEWSTIIICEEFFPFEWSIAYE